MTPEELEAEAARVDNEAQMGLALAFINFQRQMGAKEGLLAQARKERAKLQKAPKKAPEPDV